MTNGTTPRKPTRRYRAVCLECHSCWLNVQPVSRREANILAASHMLAYRHHTAVHEVPAADPAWRLADGAGDPDEAQVEE